MSVVRCNQSLCEMFDAVINYTKVITNTKDSGVNDLMNEWPNLLEKLYHEKKKIANEKVPILVLGKFFLPMLLVYR